MLRPVQPYIEYIVNQDYIVEFLCINKEEPKLQCHGKCHLAKELKKQQDDNNESLEITLENYPIGFVNILKINLKGLDVSSKKIKSAFYEKLYHSDYNFCAFLPPDIA